MKEFWEQITFLSCSSFFNEVIIFNRNRQYNFLAILLIQIATSHRQRIKKRAQLPRR